MFAGHLRAHATSTPTRTCTPSSRSPPTTRSCSLYVLRRLLQAVASLEEIVEIDSSENPVETFLLGPEWMSLSNPDQQLTAARYLSK
jgi:hypothetical protein